MLKVKDLNEDESRCLTEKASAVPLTRKSIHLVFRFSQGVPVQATFTRSSIEPE